jgi:hypothetical protein
MSTVNPTAPAQGTITYNIKKDATLEEKRAELTAQFFQKEMDQLRSSNTKNDWKRKSDELNIMVKELATLLSDLGLLMAEINQELGLEKSIPTQEISESLVKIGTQINKLPTEIENLEANIANVNDARKKRELESKLGTAKKLLLIATSKFPFNNPQIDNDDQGKAKSNLKQKNPVVNNKNSNSSNNTPGVDNTDGDDSETVPDGDDTT